VNLKEHLKEIAQNLISGIDSSPAVQLMNKSDDKYKHSLTRDKEPLPEKEDKADPIVDPHQKQSHSGPPAFGLPPSGKLGTPKLKETIAVAGGAALPPVRTYGAPIGNMSTGPSAIGEKKYKIKKDKVDNGVVYEVFEDEKSIYTITTDNESDAAKFTKHWLENNIKKN